MHYLQSIRRRVELAENDLIGMGLT